MALLVVMYKAPHDAAAFDKHYFEKHIPLAKKIPSLRKYEVSRGAVATPAGPSIITWWHSCTTTMWRPFKTPSPAPQAAVADVQTFATGGADIFMFDTRPL